MKKSQNPIQGMIQKSFGKFFPGKGFQKWVEFSTESGMSAPFGCTL